LKKIFLRKKIFEIKKIFFRAKKKIFRDLKKFFREKNFRDVDFIFETGFRKKRLSRFYSPNTEANYGL